MATRLLFVCLGNICRSPAAEGVMRAAAARAGLRVECDSAGTSGWHDGAPPDERMQAAALARGIDISGQRARTAGPGDFRRFDMVLAMDRANLRALERMRPPGPAADLRLMLDFSPHRAERETPDPYYGGPEGFEHVLDLLEDAAQGLVERFSRAG